MTKKQNKVGRPALIRKIVKIASLPPSKNSEGYFTRTQLAELLLYLDKVGSKVDNSDTITVSGENEDGSK